jgi:hypothetical protein
LQLCGQVHHRATGKKNLESRTQLEELVECASGDNPLFLYKILHLLFFLWYKFFVHYDMGVEKYYQHGLDVGPLKFQFLRPSPTHSELSHFVSG